MQKQSPGLTSCISLKTNSRIQLKAAIRSARSDTNHAKIMIREVADATNAGGHHRDGDRMSEEEKHE